MEGPFQNNRSAKYYSSTWVGQVSTWVGWTGPDLPRLVMKWSKSKYLGWADECP